MAKNVQEMRMRSLLRKNMMSSSRMDSHHPNDIIPICFFTPSLSGVLPSKDTQYYTTVYGGEKRHLTQLLHFCLTFLVLVFQKCSSPKLFKHSTRLTMAKSTVPSSTSSTGSPKSTSKPDEIKKSFVDVEIPKEKETSTPSVQSLVKTTILASTQGKPPALETSPDQKSTITD